MQDINDSNNKLETLRFSNLASSSSGNVNYIETASKKFLVDAGLSGKQTEELISQIDRDLNDIDGIFITHEHIDHCLGAGVLSRRYDIPIYANRKTWQELKKVVGKISDDNIRYIEEGDMLTIGDVDVLSFGTSHDAISPQCYAFQRGGKQLVIVNDTGYFSSKLRSLLRNSTAYLFESNHDVEMLRYGDYPWSVKQRILSDEGHLSNEDAASALADMIGNNTEHVYLYHISQNNNTKDLAELTVKSHLEEQGHAVGSDFVLELTHPDKPTPLIEL